MVAQRFSAVRQGVMATAIGLALYAQLAVHRNPNDNTAWLTFAVAALLAAAVAGRQRALAAAPRPAAARRPIWLARLALGGLAVAAIAATTYLSLYQKRPVVALSLWLASPILASFAVRGWQAAPPRRAALPWSGREIALLAAILLLAALARTIWLAAVPRAYFGDEPRVGMFLFEAYRYGAIPNFFSMGWNTWPIVGLSLQGLFAPLLGLHMWTLRLSSALMGTVGVLATYLLTRELLARRAAVLAAVLFAICRTAIDFSRLGIAHAQVLGLEPLAFFLLWRALNSGRAMAYLWAGVTTAWCLYTYNAGQLVPSLVFGWLALGALTRPSRILTHWRGVALLAAAFALILFPYAFYFTDAFHFGANWSQFTIMARNRQTLGNVVDTWHSAGFQPAWAMLSRQTWTTWLGFGVLPGGGYGLGYRKGGMLDDVSAALFILGLGMSIRRLRRGSDAFLLYWWLATVLVGGIATIDPPSFVRMVGLLPAIAILAALPLEWLTRATGAFAVRLLATGLALALVAGAAWSNYQTYFIEFASSPADMNSELVRFLEGLPADHQTALLGVEHFLQYRCELTVMEYPGRWRDVAEPAHYLPLHEPMTAPLALVLGPTQISLTEYVQSLYPGAAVRDITGPGGQPMFFRTITLTPDDVRARTGLALTAKRADGSSVEVGRADPFAEHVEAPPDAARLSWSGAVYWPTDRPQEVIVDADQSTTLTLGAAPPIVAGGSGPVSALVTLRRGWQPVHIEEPARPRRRLAIALVENRSQVPLTGWAFRPDTAREGLLATYTRPDGTSVSAVDPQLNAFAVEDRFEPPNDLLIRMPFTATWRGALRVDTPGTYQFEALGSGPYTVRLDGQTLLTGAPAEPEQPALSQQARQLDAGRHPIEVDFDSTKPAHTTRRMFQLFWTPPGGTKQLIPPTNFVLPEN